VLFVPSSSVAATTDRTFVIRVRDGTTEWVDVRTGLTSGPLVEVFGDLHPGDQVASRGTDEVRSRDRRAGSHREARRATTSFDCYLQGSA
jgi:hypothetical protein